MKIVLDAPQRAPVITGTDRIAHNVIRELQTIDVENQYELVCSAEFPYVGSAVASPNFRIRRVRSHGRAGLFLRLPLSVLRYLRRRYLAPPDAYCGFHNLNTPALKYCAVVTFALDLIPLLFLDDYYPNTVTRRRYMTMVERARKTADRFIAISEHTKEDLVRHLSIDPRRVEVIYLAVEDKFRPIGPTSAAQVLQKYGLPSQYVLSIGSNEPRKNVRAAIRAWTSLPPRLRDQFPLVVLGPPWRNIVLDRALAEQAHFAGAVADDDLPAIYAAASAFLFLSLYEGFGLPVLEAMACGTPVISSNRTSLPEVVGDAGFLVDPDDPEAVREALEAVLTDPAGADDLRLRGLERARQFSWKDTAASTLRVLERAAAS